MSITMNRNWINQSLFGHTHKKNCKPKINIPLTFSYSFPLFTKKMMKTKIIPASLLLLIFISGSMTPTKADDILRGSRRHLEGVACTQNGDCSESQYCAAGKCLDYTFCNIVADCYNPANQFFSVDCVGQVTCASDGMCAKNCSTSADTNISCYTPICDDDVKASGCDEATVCIQDRCAGGDPIYLDVAGNVVCTDNESGDTSGGSSPSISSVLTMTFYVFMSVAAAAVYPFQ